LATNEFIPVGLLTSVAKDMIVDAVLSKARPRGKAVVR
jgi:predicted MFS family arabinose efflux permease